MNKNKTIKKNNAKRKNIPRRVNPAIGPPPFHDVLTVRQIFRFSVPNGTTNSVITARNLLDLVLVSQTAILGARIMNAAKLHKVSVWAPMTATLVPVTAIISFLYGASAGTGSAGGSDYSISDTSMGADKPAYVSAVPPKNSAAAFWQDGLSAGNLFTLTCPVNSIVDVELTLRVADSNTIIPLQNPALVGATVGAVLVGGLDGVRAAGTNYPPVAFQTG